jgi:hypothetical protein
MTDGGAARMMHVASLRSLRRVEVEYGRIDVTGCIGLATLTLLFLLY